MVGRWLTNCHTIAQYSSLPTNGRIRKDLLVSHPLERALEDAHIKILKYNPDKVKSVTTGVGQMDVKRFTKVLQEGLGGRIVKHTEILEATFDLGKMSKLLEGYSEEAGLTEVPEDKSVTIPNDLTDYTLNMDTSAKSTDDEFFLTTPEEFKSEMVSGRNYIRRCAIPEADAYHMARPVVPKYRPRAPHGISKEKVEGTLETINVLNSYVPAEWAVWKARNPKEWTKIPDKAPELFMRLLKHLIPNQTERQYFIAWTYASITGRAYVYKVLCGAPGVGKNRLRLVEKALHGHINFAAGKRSTLTEKFNSQLEKKTLCWFDELKYDMDMENFMKEIQNDHLAIEKKGVDATSNSDIHVSMIISNNNPRDNYIGFDSRKFAPLELGTQDLNKVMSAKEIDTLTEKVQADRPGFDVKFVAQIAKWILKWGKKYHDQWPNLEYRGPMFWKLAHTSMTRWQKKAIELLTTTVGGRKAGWYDSERAFQWSKVQESYERRSGKNHLQFPDNTSIQNFFEIYRDDKGNKVFETKKVGGEILNDFWVKPLSNEFIPKDASLGKPPTGMTQFEWRKFKEDEAKKLGKANGKKGYDL